MKVVLFCGGSGMRLRGYVDDVPKPMVQIGSRPILWHLMKYYAHFGHKDFILCLGHKGNVIKDYFLHYEETASNDFVWSQGGKKIEFVNRDIDDWTITSQPSPHSDATIAFGKRPVLDTASANFCINGVSRCSGMLGISS